MLRLPGHWVWDSWVVDDGERYHLFFLKAPRSPDGMASRHTRAVVGHAVSVDLTTWSERPDALTARPGAWDDLAIWTGSVVRDDDGLWWMFYTGISQGGGITDQRIGVAVSDDLDTWRRIGEDPLVPVDPRRYKTLDHDCSTSETWRDPTVVRDPGGGGWHMFITARAVDAASDDDGVLAHARSEDLLRWELGPPVTRPGAGVGQLEVPQVQQLGKDHLLVFTCHPAEQTPARRGRWGDFCTWSVPGPTALGPWDIERARPFTAVADLFAAPLVQRRDGTWCLIGFRNRESEGVDGMEIGDPVPVDVDAEGYLVSRR